MPEARGQNRADTRTKGKCHDPYLRCALYGAAQVALGVRGCSVLAHSPQGCFQLVDTAFGWQDADYTETTTLCTKLCEDEIVYGGEELLARTIREAETLDISVMFVLTACGPEIVGDDIVAVCQEVAPEVPFQIVPIPCAGFRGDQNVGTDIALEAMMRALVPTDPVGEAIPKSVCLIAPHANANPTWIGDLAWVQDVVQRLGGSVVTTLTHNTLPRDWERAARAEGAIVLSHDAGKRAADWLAKECGVEQWCADLPLPIGFTHTARWLTELGQRMGAMRKARELVEEGERRVVETCRRKWLEQSAMHRAPAAIVADATIGIPLVRFITEDLELVPRLVCLRSGQKGAADLLRRELDDLSLEAQSMLCVDVYEARQALGEAMPEMVLASNIERHAVQELGIPYVFQVANPTWRFRMIDRAYFGYEGMLNLIETIQNDWWDRYRSRRRRYRARW